MSSVQSAWLNFTVRMTAPFSSSAFHGEKLASWSSRVSTISSPGPSSRPIARLIAKVSDVIFAPKTISSASQFRKSPIAARASATMRSVVRLGWLPASSPAPGTALADRHGQARIWASTMEDLRAATLDSYGHLLAFLGYLVECAPVAVQRGLPARQTLPPLHHHIHVLGVQFDSVTDALGDLRGG